MTIEEIKRGPHKGRHAWRIEAEPQLRPHPLAKTLKPYARQGIALTERAARVAAGRALSLHERAKQRDKENTA